jgi:hypothetical protein
VSASVPLNSLVDRARIVASVRPEGGYPIIDLVQKTRQSRTVCRASIGQLGSKDLAGFGVDRQVELPPDPPLWRFSKVADVNPETMGIVRAASMARSEEVRCPPGLPEAGACQASSAASENQTVRSPRRRSRIAA